MAMTADSGKRGMSSDINVTPLIDVLLVLLIIFMVIVPVTPKGLGTLLPQPSRNDESIPDTIVLSVLHAANSQVTYKINQDDVAKSELQQRLTAIYANRADRVMFLKGDDEVPYAEVAEAIDLGHSAGVDHVALMTPKLEMGQ
jgi:biopolymer transport protein TolR